MPDSYLNTSLDRSVNTMQSAFLIAVLVCTSLCADADPLAGSLVQFQWTRSSTHAASPCVAIDTHVREYAKNALLILLIGVCDGIEKGATYCDITTTDVLGRATTRTTLGRVNRAGPGDTRSGTVRRFLLESNEPSRLLWYQLLVDCGPVTLAGTVRIRYGSTEIRDLSFRQPENVPTASLRSAGVCTRLFTINAWSPSRTVLFIEWLEWQFALGVTTVYVYLHNLRDIAIRTALAAYARSGRVVVYAWSESERDDAVRRGWALAQVAHIADCFLRLEGRVRYMAALDHDEFLQPGIGATLASSLDAFYNKSPEVSRVVRVYPFSIYPAVCGTNETQFRVASFCRGEATTYGRHKYIVRCDPLHPIVLFPGIHQARDGLASAAATAATMRILHVVQFKSSDNTHLVTSPQWNRAALDLAQQSLSNADTTIVQIYVAARRDIRDAANRPHGLAETAAGACFHFFDGGANVGDSLYKVANPEAHPLSGLARAIAALNGQRFVCRRFWAFEGNPAFDDKLQTMCAQLSRQNISCTVMGGILSNKSGKASFYLDTVSPPERHQWGSSVFPGTAHTKQAVVQTKSFDLGSLLIQHVGLNDYVVVKLDVEGSEYLVLDALLRDDRRPCLLIDLMLIEWHTNSLGISVRANLERQFNTTLEQKRNSTVDKLRTCGVEVRSEHGITD